MAVSKAYETLWSTAVLFIILPHLNQGLLSDYKICGDSGCESPMSRVLAIRDYHGKDCRFLSFRRGDTIFVYHKLTGKRDDLWAGSIDKQFGYFPKDAVKEEQVHATTEKIVETQDFDFFCMDEFGSIIDSSHLDSDDGAADDDNENFQSQESEITQTTLNIDDTKAESPSKPDDVIKELPVSAQEASGTSTEVDENKVAGDGDAAAGTHEEAQETSLTQNEQGGSSSSAWLSSSVTGWLGLATEEGAGNLVEGVRKDEKKETQAKASFASSVTGWLGFGGEGEPDDAVKNSEGSPDSFTSTMTGWLGFGEEKKTDPSTETERDDEKENEKDQEPAETFRSRRMSLDLEGSQLHEEKEEMGTLEWLGNGLSNNLGFGTTKGEAEETIQEEEQPESSSWFDMGIRDILGFRGETSKDDERTGSSLKETGEDKPLEQFTGSENVDTSQSQPALTEEVSTETSNESEMEETPKDQNVSAETETEPGTTESVSTDSDKNGLDTSDSSKDSVLFEDAAPKVDQKDISPQNDLKEESQAVDGMSSVLYGFFQTGSEEKAEDVLNDNEKETNVPDGEISAEMGDKDHLMPKSIENVGEDNNPETAAGDIKDASGTDQGFLTESGINSAPDFGSADLNLNSTEHSVGKVEEDKTENEVKERDEITHQSDNTEESPDSLVKNDAGGDDHGGEGKSAETDVPQREIYASQTDDSAEHGPAHGSAEENGRESQLYLSSDTASTEGAVLTAYNEETDVDSLESLPIIGTNSEAEMHHAELGQEGHPVEGSSTEFGSSNNTEIISENETEDRGTFSTSESTIQMEDSPDQDLLSLHMPSDAHMPEEIVMETEEDRENHLQPIHTETAEMEKHILSESGLRSAVESEKEIEQVEEMQGEIEEKEVEAQEKQQGVKEEKLNKLEEFKEEEKQEETEEIMNEGKQVVVEDTKKEEETQGREEEIKVEENVMALETQQEMEEEKQGKVEELEKKGIQEEIEELKMEEKQEVEVVTKEGENQGEEEKLRKEEDIMAPETQQEVEEEMQEKVEELKEEGTHEEIEALKEEEKQEAQEGAKEDESQREMKEEKLEEVERLKEDEEQQQKEELQEEKQDNVGELTEDKRGEDLKEVEEENENERNVDDEKQVQLSLSELEMENTDKSESESDDKEMQHELGLQSVPSETPTLTENPPMEDQTTEEETKQTGKVGEEKDELKEEDVVEKQEMEDVKGERRDQEEEGELKCSNELCPQAGEDGFVRDSEENDSSNRLSSIDEGEIETETQNPLVDNDHILTDGTGVSQEVPSESTETDEGRKQEEEKRHDDAKAGEDEKENSESNLTGNEDIKSNNAKSISDYNTLGVNQIKQSDCTDNDPLCLGESGQNNLPDHIILGQTAENKEDNQLSLKEAINADVSDDNTLLQGENTEPDNTEGNSKETEQIYSDHKKQEETGEIMNEEKQVVEEDTKEEETQGREEEIKIEENVMALETQQEMEEVEEMTERDTDREERQINGKHDDVTLNEDVQMKINDDNTVSTEFRAEAGIEISVSPDGPDKSQVATSERVAPDVSQHATGSSLLSDDHNKGKAKTESGAFGLLKNAFRFFSETPDTESTESASSLDSNIDETSVAQDPLTPEQESDLTTDSTQVHVQGLHTESPITLSQQQQQQQQQQPSPPPIPQTSSPSPTQNLSHPSSHSPNTASPLQTKILSRHYKNLLSYASVEDMTVLIELFGRNKLQFLDFILGSSESSTDDPDNDESILSDIERLLHYHKDTLVAPSKRLADSPQEEKEKTRTLIALQNFELLLAKVRETFNKAKSDSSNTIRQGNAFEASKNKEISTEGQSSKVGYSSEGLDNNNPRDEWMGEYNKISGKERESPESSPHIQAGPPQPQEGVVKQTLDFIYQIAEDSTTHILAASELLMMLTVQVVSSLPDDIRPGPDLYGVPWEPVIISSVVGLMTMLLFTCRCYNSVKSRLYRSKERWMADQVAQLFDEKCKVLETLSKCQQEYDELESSLKDSSVLAQTQKTERLQAKARELENDKRELERDIEQLKDQLDQQREHRIEQERRIAVLEESMKTFEEETKDLQSQDEQAQTTLKVYNMNSERLQRNLETAREENTLLQESNAQLRQQVEGWAERVSDMESEMNRCEVTHSAMLQDVANKDERIMSLTDRLLRMKAWDSDLEEEEGEEEGEKETSNGTAENGKGERVDAQGHLQKVQKLIYAAKLNADLKSVDEDKDRAFAKLNDEVKAKEDLLESIKDLEKEKLSLQSDNEHYSDQVQRLQQKLHIMTEMYQENELKLHRLLTVEEKERLQKEEKLNKADKNIAMALEELNNYRQRAQEMEEELEKTSHSYQVQMSAHEKKAHNNWLAARAADRELADIRRENALLRQKLTDTQFKLDALDKDPYALSSLARPLPFRAERSPYGPSPLGRPASETRPFLSPPTLMDGPPARLSPRVPRGPLEPPGGQGEMERSGGPHSDSGSNSPSWERDRRGPPPGPPGPLGPPGYMFPEPGGPMYRRPPPPPAPLGYLPPPGPIPPGPLHIRGLPPGPPHPADMSDISYRENSIGPGEQEHREQSGPGDRRTPPETDPRMGGPPPPGPLMGPMDGPFPRRAPYGPPPPDFYPPRGPGGPPMMPMWNPPPPGMMFPPRFPPGGPPLPPVSHHAPPMRPPLPDGFPPPSMGPLPPQQSLPSPPHSQSPEEHRPSPEDAI